jgi:hypothetical protein
VGEDEMIEITKCIKNDGCILVNIDGHISLMSEEDQKYFIDWIKKEKPEMMWNG